MSKGTPQPPCPPAKPGLSTQAARAAVGRGSAMSSGAGLGSIPVPRGERTVISAPEVLMEGIVFGESARWHDGRVWFSDWGANQVIALDPGGSHQVAVTVPSFPMCIDFLPDGRLLVVDSAQRRLLRRDPNGRSSSMPTFPGSRTSRGTISSLTTGATPTSTPSVLTFPAASSRRAWSCSSPRRAPPAR